MTTTLARSASEGSEFRIQNSGFRTTFCILHSAFCILFAAGCGPTAIAQPQPAAAGGSALEVVIAGRPVRKTLTLTTTQPARIEAIEQTPIHSKLSAYVAEVLVDYGDQVKKDQPLVKLAAPELDAELAQKQALLEQAKAELVQADSGLKAAQAAVNTAKSQVTQTEARLERTQADVERWRLQCKRYEDLSTSGSVTRQLVEETQQNCSAAQATHREALASIDSAKAVVAQSEAQAAKAAADVAAAQARLQVAEANVDYTQSLRSYLTIRSPFDGVVTARHVDPGHFVQPATASGGKLLVVARTDKMRVFAAIPEIEAAYVDLGDPATVEVQSLRGSQFPGAVTRTSFALDPSSRSLETIVDIDNADGRLRPGLYGLARILLEERKDALSLPSAAVVRQGREAFCFKLVGGKAQQTAIQLGIKVGEDFEVTGGLADGDTVILNKAGSLKDGQAVEVLKVEATK
jgi:HlyD family secretion protein